ncbi:Uncharacterised protein [Mycobacteroides abscessus subsp. massiliense]|nr:Uncharacterised protein [Mycobacteroides abscessus subsp. massiliense]
MLNREHLGGRQERALVPGVDRLHHREQRDDRLTRAHLTLQQPVHRLDPGEIGTDLGDYLLLSLGELERQLAQ